MTSPDPATLRLFVLVCEERSMGRAAERVHLVASAVSKRLAALEERMGVPLLQRRRHGMEPTAAGLALLEHARSILADCERLDRDMAAFAQGVRGQVRVLATASALAGSLAQDVAAFLRAPQHHDIRIDLEERVSNEVVRGIRQGGASLGLCWDSPFGADLSGLATQPYRQDHLAVVLPQGHPLAAGHQGQPEALRFADTLAFEHVVLPVNAAVTRLLQRQAAALGHNLRWRVVVSNFESALNVVQAGLAISVLPQEMVLPYAQIRQLTVRPLQEPWAARRLAICMRNQADLPPAATLLLQHLVAVARAA
ncbi:MAG: hypothetical protein RLZZ126_1504 [Pseudomonadota bacterium]|jgi:DNA-binding transcriptional LysR family regulator